MEVVLDKKHQSVPRRPMGSTYSQLEIGRKENVTENTSISIERRGRHFLERHHLAESRTGQADWEAACWGYHPTTGHNRTGRLGSGMLRLSPNDGTQQDRQTGKRHAEAITQRRDTTGQADWEAACWGTQRRDTTGQADWEAACWGYYPTTGHNSWSVMTLKKRTMMKTMTTMMIMTTTMMTAIIMVMMMVIMLQSDQVNSILTTQ